MDATQLPLLPDNKQTPQPKPNEKKEVLIKGIPGLRYIENYITEDEQDQLLAHVDKEGLWLKDLKRRVQHYGFKYNYKARKVDMSMRVGELPKWLKDLSVKLYQEGYMPKIADQVIVNEYEPGQGISAHIDCEPCFQDTITSLSLGSSCVMEFTNKFDKNEKVPLWLDPGSLIVLSDEARYSWLHAIPPRQKDKLDGREEHRSRKRRVSLTFRKVIIG
ncbi:alpha-ketoglutarate-dependent dioxygenase AlkB [Candidatus Poribacteria bacterium]|nr:MAG: alpha-ketoglutarate-dependent dioxygenase AlkB [Candidatus Poribacteria bacterium]